jgi:hypothetical protein
MAVTFSANPTMRWRVHRIGAEQAPVLVVDDFISDPHALASAAVGLPYISIGTYYPGVRAPTPAAYAKALCAGLSPLIEETFGAALEPKLHLCAFSLVTTPAERLSLEQRIPHFDGVGDRRIATIHYLCGPDHGGTAFYRHRSTGFESVSADRVEPYFAALRADIAAHGEPPSAYIKDHTPLFERIAGFEAAYNRMLVYRGHALHSGDVGRDAPCAEPRTGRLTVNAFGQLQPRS